MDTWIANLSKLLVFGIGTFPHPSAKHFRKHQANSGQIDPRLNSHFSKFDKICSPSRRCAREAFSLMLWAFPKTCIGKEDSCPG